MLFAVERLPFRRAQEAAIEIETDEHLVEVLQREPEAGQRAFGVLVERHQSKVMANCRYLTRAPDDAEDLAQEVFVKAFYALSRFEGRSTFRTWLHRIKINHCLNYLDKKKNKTHVALDEAVTSGHEALQSRSRADDGLKARSERERIGAILDELSDSIRLPLLLRDLDGLSYQEIADELGVGLSAVKMRIKRGREEFRAMWNAAERPTTEDAGP